MNLPRLAWRNLRRNRRRTLLTVSALSVGLMMLVISRGLLDGADSQSIHNLIDYEYAYGKGFVPGYPDAEFPGLDMTIVGASYLVEAMEKYNPEITATPRLSINGMVIHGSLELPVNIIGVDPYKDPKVFTTLDAVVRGERLAVTDTTGAVLLGDKLAGELDVEPGDQVTLLARSAPGAWNPVFLPVKGILSTGHPGIDQFSVFIPLKTAQEIALLPGAATEVAFRIPRLSRVSKELVKLRDLYPQLEWRSWKSLAADFLAFARMKRMGSGIVIMVFSLMAAVGVANTMIMAIHERSREIGTLRAIGVSSGQVGRLFLLEGLFIGVISAGVAMIIGSITLALLGINGIGLEKYGDIDIGYPIRTAIYPIITFRNLAFGFLFGVLISLVASWGAARRAARGEVVRALREGML